MVCIIMFLKKISDLDFLCKRENEKIVKPFILVGIALFGHNHISIC